MGYVTEGGITLWKPGPGEPASPTQAQITSQLDTSGSAGADWRNSFEVSDDTTEGGARFKAKMGEGAAPTPGVTPPAAPVSPGGGGSLGAPTSLGTGGAVMDGLQAAGPSPDPGLGFTQKSGVGALNPKLGQRIPPDIFSSLKALTY